MSFFVATAAAASAAAALSTRRAGPRTLASRRHAGRRALAAAAAAAAAATTGEPRPSSRQQQQRRFSQRPAWTAATVGSARGFTQYGMPPPKPPSRSASPKKNEDDEGRGGPVTTAYIALGSNLGDRIAMIERACAEMDARGIRVKRTSSLWETEPMYVLDQARFVNGACEVETHLKPLALLDQLQAIETAMGRQKVVDKGPRNIDLDILLYGDRRVDTERLKVPHAGIPEREFVLRPLAELIPHKPIDPDRPWKLCQDYLNELPQASTPLTTLTPLSADHPPLQPLNRTRQTQVMAILNVTPDSFSDGGAHSSLDADALAAAAMGLADAGAAIIDVGGQSTAPHAPEVPPAEELRRVVPAIEAIGAVNAELRAAGRPPVLVSVDTYRAEVAEAAIAAGADIVNDVSAGLLDPQMLPTVARLGVTVCLTHMRGTPATMNTLSLYGDEGGSSNSDSCSSPAGRDQAAESDDADANVVPAVARELLARVAAAEAAGVRRWRIMLDPGLGFAKARPGQNLEVLRRLDELRGWPGLEGLPWLLGPSRKRFIGAVTGVAEPAARVWGTAAAVAASVQGGADVVRVHDVRPMAQVVAMSDAIWRRR